MHDTLLPNGTGDGDAVGATSARADEPVSAEAQAAAAPQGPIPSKRSSRLHHLAATLTFTAPQRRAMIVVLGVVLLVLMWRIVRDRAEVPDPQPKQAANADRLESRLDPNAATWEELVALPQLGEKRARAIVEYREERAKRRPGQPAFTQPIDLVVVKGIGLSMVENLTPHLRFPAATRPADSVPAPR
jgi:DNA uptake protein ComE-like DNA-binding protein